MEKEKFDRNVAGIIKKYNLNLRDTVIVLNLLYEQLERMVDNHVNYTGDHMSFAETFDRG